MVVRADLVEDFSKSLCELNDMLSVPLNQKDPVLRGVARDAQLFTFLRSSDVLRSLVRNIHAENCTDHYPVDTETAVISLCMLDLIDDEQARDILNQLDAAEFLALDRNWLDQEDDRRVFDEGVHDMSMYCNGMMRLLNDVCSECTLIEEEDDVEGH